MIEIPDDGRATSAALRTLRDYVVDENSQVSFPVDPIAIAEDLGIVVRTSALAPDVAGVIVKEDSATPVNILLNASDGNARQRFTCAHELGHYVRRQATSPDSLIGYVDYRNEIATGGSDPEENWANAFAAELLMPAFAVRSLWADGRSAKSMASDFGVSGAAMNVRLKWLGLA